MFQPSLAYIVGDPFHFPQAYVRASHYERRASRPQTVAPYPKRQSMNGHLVLILPLPACPHSHSERLSMLIPGTATAYRPPDRYLSGRQPTATPQRFFHTL